MGVDTSAIARHDRLAVLALLIAVFVINYLTMPGHVYRGDPVTIRVATTSLIKNGTLDVPPAIATTAGDPGQYFYLNHETGKWYSIKGVANTLLYLPPLIVEKLWLGKLSYDDPLMKAERARLFILNLYFIFLGMGVAYLLYRIARTCIDRPAVCLFFTLSALYSTFLWNYQRGQTYDLFQVLFFLVFLLHYQRFLGNQKVPSLLMATLSVGILVHVKSIYVFLFPVVGLGALAAFIGKHPTGEVTVRAWLNPNTLRVLTLGFLVPAVASILLLLLANDHKFGFAFNTGYGQWHRYEGVDLFSGDVGTATRGFLFDPQRSLFLHFPLLIFAVLGVRRFWNEHPHMASMVFVIFFGYFFLYAMFIDWKGELSYGPRYLLFILPALSLPFLLFIDEVLNTEKRSHKALVWAVLLPVLGLGVASQVLLNSLEYFAYYDFMGIASALGLLEFSSVATYFRDTHFSLVHHDLINFLKHGMPLPFAEAGSPVDLQLRQWLSGRITGNYFWWDVLRTR